MSPVLRSGSLFDHMRHLCVRPRMFAPEFTLDHLHLYIIGYEDGRRDAGLPSQYVRFREWLLAQHPDWRHLPEWWAKQILHSNSGDLYKTLDDIIVLLDRFLATEGAEFSHFPPPRHIED